MIGRLYLRLHDPIGRRAHAPPADLVLAPSLFVHPFARPEAAERDVPAPAGAAREAS